ncbi:MAG: RNase H family protein [Candidatus Paceibacterota bacterium]
MYDPNALKIYTDGSSQPNPGRGGIGIIIEFPDHLESENIEISEGYKNSNNQRMELMACIVSFQWIKNNTPLRGVARAIFITDSLYVCSNYANAQYWKNNQWKDQHGKPYENKDLWDTFLKERQKVSIPIEIKWEKGKTRSILDRVDMLAKQGAKFPLKNDSGYQPGKFTKSRTGSKKSAILFPANNQEILIRVYAKKVYGKNENELLKITFDVFDENERKYNKKYFAYKGKDCEELERNNCYRVIFNGNLKMPLMLKAEHIEYLK